MAAEINNFTVLESVHGRFVVNRHCSFQAEALVKTGRTHIEPELDVLLRIAATVPEQGVVVDAGANVGFVAIPLARALYDRRAVVLAFEVQRMMYYALCGSAALNDLQNLIAFHQGLGAIHQDMPIAVLDYGADQDFGAFSLLHPLPERPDVVKIAPLDSMGLARLDLLKIDVEGMEIEVLQGARQTMVRHRPWCWIEYWKVGAERVKNAFDYAHPDYKLFIMDELNMLCAPAEKLAASGLVFDGQPV